MTEDTSNKDLQYVLTVLMDIMAAGSSRCQHCATLILRNMCCHAPNKPKLLAADDLIAGLVQQVENSGQTETQLVATSALVALVYNNHKARVHVKSTNIAPRLAETLHNLQTSVPRSGVTGQSCDNLKIIIKAVQD